MIIVFNFTYNSNCSKESSEEEKMKKTYKKEGGHLQKNFLTFKNTQMMQRYMMISFQK